MQGFLIITGYSKVFPVHDQIFYLFFFFGKELITRTRPMFWFHVEKKFLVEFCPVSMPYSVVQLWSFIYLGHAHSYCHTLKSKWMCIWEIFWKLGIAEMRKKNVKLIYLLILLPRALANWYVNLELIKIEWVNLGK